MQIIEITDLSVPELAPYTKLTESQLRNKLEPEKGIFIAESPKVIGTALDAGCEPLSFLMERRQIDGPAAGVLARCPDATVYTADRSVLQVLTGYVLTRGVLCAMRRPAPHTAEELWQERPPRRRFGRYCGLYQHRRDFPGRGGSGHGRCAVVAVLL